MYVLSVPRARMLGIFSKIGRIYNLYILLSCNMPAKSVKPAIGILATLFVSRLQPVVT